MHRRCKTFLHEHPINSHHSGIFIGYFLNYLHKYLPQHDLSGYMCKKALHCRYIQIEWQKETHTPYLLF